MAIFAVARITSTDVNGAPATGFSVTVSFEAYNTSGNVHHGGASVVDVPFDTNPVKADRSLRETVAAQILSSWSWVIDPADIYGPAL